MAPDGTDEQTVDTASLQQEIVRLRKEKDEILARANSEKDQRRAYRDKLLAYEAPGITPEDVGDLPYEKVIAIYKRASEASKPSEASSVEPDTSSSSTPVVSEGWQEYEQATQAATRATPSQHTAKELFEQLQRGEISDSQLNEMVAGGRMKV